MNDFKYILLDNVLHAIKMRVMQADGPKHMQLEIMKNILQRSPVYGLG